MKKILVLACCFFSYLMPAWGCIASGPVRGTYEIKDGQVFYSKPYDRNNLVFIETADATSLTYLNGEGPSTYEEMKWYFTDYVLDNNHVYYQGQVLEGINPAQAVLLEQRFDQIVLIDSIDQYVSQENRKKLDGYLKDNERVYYYGQLLQGVNGAHFGWLPFYNGNHRRYNHDYAHDDQHIYLYGQKVAGDAKTAQEISYGYYLDANHIYFRGEVLEGATPDAFELKGVFIISNGHVYYQGKQLPLDVSSFEVLKNVHGNPIIGCGGTTYAGSFIKDHNGIYLLQASGDLKRLEGVDAATFKIDEGENWAADKQQMYLYWKSGNTVEISALKLKPQQAYLENIKLDDLRVIAFYKDDHSLYLSRMSASGAKNLEDLLKGDAKTFGIYAALLRAVIFRDKTGFYLARVTSYPRDAELIKVVNGNAKLVCLEANHLCLLSGNMLYYIFDDGTVEQTPVYGKDLQCIQGNRLLPTSLDMRTSEGKAMCFDRRYFYNRGEREEMYSGGYDEALSYAVTAEQLEQKRVESLKRVNIEHKPLSIEEKPENDVFNRWYFY